MPERKPKIATKTRSGGTRIKTDETDSVSPTVYMEKSTTKNLGDYNSAKITVGITVPINPTDEHLRGIKATIEILNDVIDTEIEEQLKGLV